jgi:hypothetical protein
MEQLSLLGKKSHSGLMGIWMDHWNTRNEILHDSMGVQRIPARQLNASITAEWQNGTEDLLDQDKALIRGTTLPQLLQTKQEHKLTWLAQIRRARLAYDNDSLRLIEQHY